MADTIHVTVWNEFRHEKKHEAVRKVYPDGMHVVIAKALATDPAITTQTATLDEPEHGLTPDVLAATDVLVWWGHMAHKEVRDEIVQRVQQSVLQGMGLIVLHSGHFSKILRTLLGTTCSLKWREAGEKERLWNVEPSHPITEGIGEYIELPHTEMYGERFDIPTPDKLIFLSWFQGGEVFRSGCCWQRGHGRIFYFRPGHETYPIYYNKEVIRVLVNAAKWARKRVNIEHTAPNVKPIEPLGADQKA
ncbi:MAG TPA: ThuA domain-containing protein [Phycisphaerae bacterium]|nr:ThuA domain-containing protein [Phycisphaerae bacterium]